MRKGTRKAEMVRDSVVYRSGDVSVHRIDGRAHLFGQQDLAIGEAFEMVVWGTRHRPNDEDFWEIKLTQADVQNARPINMIYWLTGGDSIWKTDSWIWDGEWTVLSEVFVEHFGDKIMKAAKSAKTLGDLRRKIKNRLSYEDFYELGISVGIINEDDALL